MATQAALAKMERALAAEGAAHQATRIRMIGYLQGKQRKDDLLGRRLGDIADLKAQLKRSEKRVEWLEAELRAIQRVVLRALDRSFTSPEDSIESTGRSAAPRGVGSAQPARELTVLEELEQLEHAVPFRPAVRADNGATGSDAHAAAVHAAGEEVERVISSMGSASISPPPSYSGVVVWATSEDSISGKEQTACAASKEGNIMEDL